MTGIHVNEIPPLRYDRQLFHEKTLTSVTAYTRPDGEEFLRLAEALAVEPVVTGYPFEAADRDPRTSDKDRSRGWWSSRAADLRAPLDLHLRHVFWDL